MRLGTKLLLGFIPLVILTAMVAEALYVNSKRISDSSRLLKETYQAYGSLLEMGRQQKNFSFYREKFYLHRMKEASERAAEIFSRMQGWSGDPEAALTFTRVREDLKKYQSSLEAILNAEGPGAGPEKISQLESLGHQLEKSSEQLIGLAWLPIEVATGKARTYSWLFAVQAGLIAAVLAFYFGRLLVRPIRQLLRATRKVAEGDFSQGVSIPSRDEIGELAESFNRMVLSLRQGRAELERSGQELRKTKDTLENIVQSSVDAIVATDPRGRITFANRSMQEMVLGKSGEEEKLLGLPMSRLYPGGLAEAQKVMAILRDRGRLMNYETTLVSNGRTIPILTSASLLKDEEGKVIGTLGVIKDLTEKKRLEEELKKAQADLVQTEKLAAIGRLASGVAHEMNDPLTSILTFGNLLREDVKEGDATQESLDIILKEAIRAKKIISDLLSFSREAKPSLQWIDLNDVLNMSLLLLEKQGAVEGIEVQMDLAGELPLVRADAGQLQQVFTNILFNASQAVTARAARAGGEMRERKIFLQSRFQESREEAVSPSPLPGPFIRVTVRDTGAGIPADLQDKVFDPFFTTKGTGEGTGLGLYIVSGILKNYGARYHLESEEGRGTTFIIDFPLSGNPN